MGLSSNDILREVIEENSVLSKELEDIATQSIIKHDMFYIKTADYWKKERVGLKWQKKQMKPFLAQFCQSSAGEKKRTDYDRNSTNEEEEAY